MKKLALLALLMLPLAGLLLACAATEESKPSDDKDFAVPLTAMRARIAEQAKLQEVPDLRVMVSHILIKADRDRNGDVSTIEWMRAEATASVVYDRLVAGQDFDTLAKEFSEDGEPGRPGGPYAMWSKVEPQKGESKRNGMVKAFGDVGWLLNVGEIGIAPFHKKDSPYGWHIIKRVE